MILLKNNPLLTLLTPVKRFARVMWAGAALCLFSSAGSAALLGVQPDFPQTSFDNQGTTNFSNTNLAINGNLIGFKFLVSDTPYFTFGTVVINAKVSAACTVLSNDPNPELTVVGDLYDPNTFALVLSGTLLTGEIAAIGVQSVSATTTAIDFRFNTAGGLLVSGGYWPAGKDIGAVMTVENSNFVDCVQAFSGGAKGTVGPIEPPAPPVCSTKGARSQGYWKNHLGSWPVDNVTVGGITYDARTARNLMKRPPKGDQTWTLYRQLLGAILNVANGTCPTCIQSTIDAANQWLIDHPLGSGVKASSAAWQDSGEDLKDTLDAYNNGLLCAPRDKTGESGGDEDTEDNGPGHDHGDHHGCRHS